MTRLQKIMQERGLTVQQLADLSGIDKTTVGYLKNDKRPMLKHHAEKLAQALNVSGAYLMGLTKPKLDFETNFADLALVFLDQDNLTVEDITTLKGRLYAKLSLLLVCTPELNESDLNKIIEYAKMICDQAERR